MLQDGGIARPIDYSRTPDPTALARALEVHLVAGQEDVDVFAPGENSEVVSVMEGHGNSLGYTYNDVMDDEEQGGVAISGSEDDYDSDEASSMDEGQSEPRTELDLYAEDESYWQPEPGHAHHYFPHFLSTAPDLEVQPPDLVSEGDLPVAAADETLHLGTAGVPRHFPFPHSSAHAWYHSAPQLSHEHAEELFADMPSVPDLARVAHVCDFVERWIARWYEILDLRRKGNKLKHHLLSAPPPQRREALRMRSWQRITIEERNNMASEEVDVQGIDWAKIGTTRRHARKVRKEVFSSLEYYPPSIQINDPQASKRPSNTERFYEFRRLQATHQPFINHYQLRNLIAVRSPDDVFYATQAKRKGKIMRADPDGPICVMDLSQVAFDSFSTTCLYSSDDTLIAGGFEGNYAYKGLHASLDAQPTYGEVTPLRDGISNHVHTFKSRQSGLTNAAFCSNDKTLRVLDCTTNTFTDSFTYPFQINCAATSSNNQMRLVAGDRTTDPTDSFQTLVTAATTGEVIHTLRDHTADAFACAWADDNRYFATGAQDDLVCIYDARNFREPVKRIRSEVSCPRSIRFTPVGGGRPLLIVAEAEDIVSVIDARTFATCQVLDSFGPLGGMDLSPDGQSLVVANADSKFGGLLEYSRVGFSGSAEGLSPTSSPWDWESEGELEANRRVRAGKVERERRGLGWIGELVI